MLRPMTSNDLRMVLDWRNQESIRKNMYTTHEITWEEHCAWWERVSISEKFKYFIFEEDGPQGVVSFSDIDQKNMTAIWAFYTGPKAPKGIGSRMEAAALECAFETLGLFKLVGEVLSHNMRVVALHRRFGFRIEGIYRKQFVAPDGSRLDVYRVAMFASDYAKHLKAQAKNNIQRVSGGRLDVGAQHNVSLTYSAEEIADFAKLSGDTNPVHLDDEAAIKQGFERRIAHGVLPCAELSRVLGTEFPGKGTVFVGLNIQFMKPIYPDVQMNMKLSVVSKIGTRHFIEVGLNTLSGELLLAGECEVLYKSL